MDDGLTPAEETRPAAASMVDDRGRSPMAAESRGTVPDVDRDALRTRLDRLLTLRGDPKRGLGAAVWQENLSDVERELTLRAALDAVRELLVPDWAAEHRDDKRPQEALDAAGAWLDTKSAESLAQAKAAAKACTAARNETFGRDHRVPQAARSVAWAAGAKDDTTHVFDALASVEEELLARIALTTEYHLAPEKRRALVDVVKRAVAPEQADTSAEAPKAAVSGDPVPYSADGHFELGQRLVHKKFGDVVVSSVGETWIEVELGDGSKKRLAHKP